MTPETEARLAYLRDRAEALRDAQQEALTSRMDAEDAAERWAKREARWAAKRREVLAEIRALTVVDGDDQ